MKPRKTDLPIFIDIDGTLTLSPYKKWGEVLPKRIAEVRRLIDGDFQVVLWSGGGTRYVRDFAVANGLIGAGLAARPDFFWHAAGHDLSPCFCVE